MNLKLYVFCFCIFFFFSSRRRHTRLTCDWSSDVCSSDLEASRQPVASTPTNQAVREHKKSAPPPTPQMTPYISHAVRAPPRKKRADSSDDEEEAGTQTVWQIHTKEKESEWDPYQVLQNGSKRLVDGTI